MRSRVACAAVAAVAAFVSTSVGTAGASLPGQAWVSDGPISAVALAADGTTYVGGSFTTIAPYSGGAGALDLTSGGPLTSWPRVAGTVNAVVADGSGGWIVGGEFSSVEGESRANLARIRADGTLDPAWRPRSDGPVHALALSGGAVLVGGDFSLVDGEPRAALAAVSLLGATVLRWDARLACAGCSAARPIVRALAVAPGGVFAGGSFDSASGESRPGLALLGAGSGQLLGWHPASALREVLALAIDGDTVLVGGVPGTAASGLEALDASDGTSRVLPFVDGPVRALSADAARIYLGGSFAVVGGATRRGLAALTAGAHALLAWSPGASGDVRALRALPDGRLAVGGALTELAGVARRNLGMLDASGRATAWSPQADGPVHGLAAEGQTLVAGGELRSFGAAARRHAAALAPSGSVLPWRPDPDGPVTELAVDAGSVYLAGAFTTLAGAARSGVGAVDTLAGAARPWDPQPDGPVTALAISGSDVVLGGRFGSLRGGPHAAIAIVDNGAGLARAWAASLACIACTPAVSDLAVVGETIVAAGSFDSVGGQPRAGLAGLARSDGAPSSWAPQPDCGGCPAAVDHVAALGPRLYVSGPLTSVGGIARPGLAELDLASGSAGPFSPPVPSGFGWALPAPITTFVAAAAPDGSLTLLDGAGAPAGGLEPVPALAPLALASRDGVLAAAGRLSGLASTTGAAARYVPGQVLARPQLTGTRTVGSLLRCQPASAGAIATAWLRDGALIGGATGSTYEVDAEDATRRLACRIALPSGDGMLHADSRPQTIDRVPALAAAPAAAPAQDATARPTRLTLLARRAQVEPGGSARVAVACEAPDGGWCSGSVSLLLPARAGRTPDVPTPPRALSGRRGGSYARVIARRLIALRNGTTREIRLDLTELGMQLLAKRRKLAVTLVVRLGPAADRSEHRLRLVR